MRAGKLRHRVTIQEKGTPARNSYGEEVISWP
jgi:head-tail adaptor